MAMIDGRRQTADSSRRSAAAPPRADGVSRRSGLAVGLLLIGMLVGWLAGSLLDRPPRGVVYGVPPNVALAYHDLGATVDLTQLDPAARERLWNDAPCLQVRWLRQPIRWREVERTQGQYDWSRLDAPVAEAHTHGFKLLAVLQDSPDWTRDAQQSASAPPKDWRDFGRFARAVAERYRDQIAAYQIWDEPNIAAGWGGAYPNAHDYATLLRDAAINIRAAAPQAQIISAALAPTSESGPLNDNEPDYLRQLYRTGAHDDFDAVGAEPFGFWSGPDDRRVDVSALNFSRLILLREVMQANGDDDKALWATAFGWAMAGVGDPAFGGDEPGKQWQRTADAIRRARDEWPWLGPLMFARWQLIGTHDPRAGFALNDAEGRAQWLRSVGCPAIRPATVGHYTADDPSAVYPSTWRVTPAGADIPQDDKTPLKIHFRGTRFDLSMRRGSYEGALFVQVDGASANALPHDEQGRSYVVLFDPLGQTAEVTLARGLADQEHVVEIVPQGGWGQWAIVGWTVARERSNATWWSLIGAVVSVLVFGIGIPQIANRKSQITYYVSRITLRASRFTSLVTDHSSLVVCAAGIALYLSPNAIASWTLIALLALLILWRLDAGLALVAFAIPFYLQPKALGIGSYSVVEIVVLLCAASFVIRPLTTDNRRPTDFMRSLRSAVCRLSSFDWLVALWLIAGGVGVLVAENFGVAYREFRVVFFEPALYYLLVRASHIGVRPLANAFLAGAAVVSAKAVADALTHSDLIAVEGVLRVRSVYASPNNLALYLDRAAPLALALAAFGRSRRGLYLVAFGLMIVALYLTFAKGSWLLALPAALLFIGLMRGRKAFVGSLIGLAVLGASLLPVLGTARLRSLFDLTTGTSFARVQLWQSAIAMIRDHPIFGVGLDNFLYQYRTRYILPSAFAETGLSHPHNILLDFWTRLGLLGVVLFIALLAIFWRQALHVYRQQPDGTARALTLGLMASMVAALAHGLIDNSFFLVDLAFVLMLTLSVLSSES